MGPRMAAVGLEPTSCPGGSSSFKDSPLVTQTALSIELRRPNEARAQGSGITGSSGKRTLLNHRLQWGPSILRREMFRCLSRVFSLFLGRTQASPCGAWAQGSGRRQRDANRTVPLGKPAPLSETAELLEGQPAPPVTLPPHPVNYTLHPVTAVGIIYMTRQPALSRKSSRNA